MKDFETFDPSGVLEALDYGVWVFDFKESRVLWANRKALEFWQAPTLDELRSRDMGADMSPSVQVRLQQYWQDVIYGKPPFYERWTIYPHGNPVTMRVRYSGWRTPDGATHLLCEARPSAQQEPDSVRSVDALLHTVDMVSLYSMEGGLLYSNPAARAFIGRTLPEAGPDAQVLGRWAARFVDPAQAATILEAVLRDGTCQVVAEVAGQGTRTWHRVSALRCHDPITGQQAFLVTEQDVTETELTKHELERARNQAMNESRAKTDFVAEISHELRTPLNGVVGATEILRDGPLSGEQERLVDILWNSSRDLLNTVNGILDLAKIEANEVAVDVAPFDLAEVLDRVLSNHQSSAAAKGVALQWHGRSPCMRRGDPGLLAQILHNLVGNAVKFTQDGAVDVVVDCRSGDWLELEVTDTGIGLTQEQIARIPRAFEQADSSTRRTYGGTGLGLTIVQKLLNALHGDMKITSEPGQGTCVRVRLPLPAVIRRGGDVPDAADAAPISAHALVVDDVATNSFLLGKMLESRGLTVSTAANGCEAVDLVARERFDIILCDIAMPDMDGITTLHEIRRVEVARALPPAMAIAVTANAFDHQIIDYLDSGFGDCLSKPITKAEIDRALSHLRRGAC